MHCITMASWACVPTGACISNYKFKRGPQYHAPRPSHSHLLQDVCFVQGLESLVRVAVQQCAWHRVRAATGQGAVAAAVTCCCLWEAVNSQIQRARCLLVARGREPTCTGHNTELCVARVCHCNTQRDHASPAGQPRTCVRASKTRPPILPPPCNGTSSSASLYSLSFRSENSAQKVASAQDCKDPESGFFLAISPFLSLGVLERNAREPYERPYAS